MLQLLLKAVWVTDVVGTLNQGAVDRRLEGSLVEIPVGVGRFPVDAVVEFAIWFPGDEDINESDLVGLLLLHGELDSGVG